jgi:hypothetical protein
MKKAATKKNEASGRVGVEHAAGCSRCFRQAVVSKLELEGRTRRISSKKKKLNK